MTTWLTEITQHSGPVLRKLVRGEVLCRRQLLLLLALAASFLWAYWPTFADMAERWAHEPQYSHGYLVPLFAAFLLWQRREHCPSACHGSPWGVLLLAAAAALLLAGAYFRFPYLEGVSLVPCLFGLCLLLGGRAAVGWCWPAICFLLFMLPLPFRVEVALAQPLQRLATQASTVCLVVLGVPATASGNVITLTEDKIGVAEACSGLSMLLTFLALAVACALVIRRPLLDRCVIVASAIPIALCANVARITITGALHEWVSGDAARAFFHDLAGWFMMGIALALVWVELQVLSRLLREAPASAPMPVHFPWAGAGAPRPVGIAEATQVPRLP